jgi:hypothetical protein
MLIGQIVLIFISWIPHAAERLYVVITLYDVKTPLRTAQDNLWDQTMWIVTTFDSSLSFYVYLFTGGILFRQTLRQMFRRVAVVTGATTLTEMSLNQRRTINWYLVFWRNLLKNKSVINIQVNESDRMSSPENRDLHLNVFSRSITFPMNFFRTLPCFV